MTKIDDLKQAVTDLGTAILDQLAAVDKEIAQMAALVASGGLPPDAQESLQTSIDNITAATQSIKDSTAKLASDDI